MIDSLIYGSLTAGMFGWLWPRYDVRNGAVPHDVTGRQLMTVEELTSQRAAQPGTLVIDVRSAFEFGRGHIPGAVHLPFWAALFRFPTPPPSAPIILYCGHGPRAWIARAALRVRGVRQVYLLEGHMAGWRRAMRAEQTGTESWRPAAKGARR